jgi:hypothetical protein
LLFASLLEGISINPAIVVIPGHVFLGWETEPGKNRWGYLETTMIGAHEFEEAVNVGERKAKIYAGQAETNQDLAWFRRWDLRTLRTQYNITPME